MQSKGTCMCVDTTADVYNQRLCLLPDTGHLSGVLAQCLAVYRTSDYRHSVEWVENGVCGLFCQARLESLTLTTFCYQYYLQHNAQSTAEDIRCLQYVYDISDRMRKHSNEHSDSPKKEVLGQFKEGL